MNSGRITRKWTAWRRKYPVVFFLLTFSLLIIIFYIIYLNPWVQDKIFNPWVNFNAYLSGKVLNLLGQRTTTYLDTISSVRASVSVKKGCDAMEPIALFVAGILAFPAHWKKKAIGLAVGLLVIFVLNIIRIVALFLTSIYHPDLFGVMHIEVWQVIFILVAIATWFLWLRWAVIKPVKT